MPPHYVNTIEEEIYYEYAKLISRSAFDGKLMRGFITSRFKALQTGRATMSGTIREWQREYDLPKQCVFCGSQGPLETDHLIPRSRGGNHSAGNVVWACRSCNASRGDKAIFAWLGLEKKDSLHRIVAGKYLKQLFEIHAARGTLETSKDSITVLCHDCENQPVCVRWNTVAKLTCFCLESVF